MRGDNPCKIIDESSAILQQKSSDQFKLKYIHHMDLKCMGLVFILELGDVG